MVMTKAEMDARKMEVIRFLVKENLPMDRLQLFESTRDLMIEWKRKQQSEEEKTDNISHRLSEPDIEYSSLSKNTTIDTRIADLIHYLLDEIREEDDLIEFQVLCNDRMPPCMFTVEELQERLREAEARFERGEGIPHEEILQRILSL